MLRASQKMNDRGFTLVEMLISLGMIGTISLGVMQYLSHANDNNLFTEARASQMSTTRTLIAAVNQPEDLKKSLGKGGPGNLELQRCMDSGPTAKAGNCSSVGEGRKTYFDLFAGNGRRIAGTNADPVTYDRRGAVCVPDGGTCPFMQAKSHFWVTCPPDPISGKAVASCPQASSMIFKVELEPVLKGKSEYLGRPLQKSEYKVSHRIFEALGANQDCPVGAEMNGTDKGGVASCRCRAGYKQGPNLPDGTITCDPLGLQTCPEGQLMNGRQANGAPMCIAATIFCSIEQFTDESAGCKLGGWLETIDLGTCRPQRAGKKASEKNIKCDRNQGKCCHYVY